MYRLNRFILGQTESPAVVLYNVLREKDWLKCFTLFMNLSPHKLRDEKGRRNSWVRIQHT